MKPVSEHDLQANTLRMIEELLSKMRAEPYGTEMMEALVEGKQTCKVYVEISFTAVNSPKQLSDETQPQHEAYEPDPF